MKIHRKALLAGAMLFGAVAFSGWPALAQEVDDLSFFELDGDAEHDGVHADDWETVNAGGGTSLASTGVLDDPAGTSIFIGGGSKDVRDVSEWNHTAGAVPDKDDITNAYAAAYESSGDLVIYAGADRFANNGDANIGFWFFKNEITLNGDGTFGGVHAVGDILVVVEFSGGGSVASAKVFEWTGTTIVEIASVAAATCVPGLSGTQNDNVCGISNQGSIQLFWSYTPKFDDGTPAVNEAPAGSFIEVGINVNELLGTEEGICFSSFLAETRSSTSKTAQLKDFVLGGFPVCGIEVTKTCSAPSVDEDGVSILTPFNVSIENTGFGAVSDVAIREVDLPTGDTCKITGVNGVPVTEVSLPSNTDVAVPGPLSIAANTTATVQIECDTFENPFLNKVVAKAKSSPAQSTRDLTDNFEMTEGCSITVNPDLTVVKTCDPVKLIVDNGKLVVQAQVDITVTNTGIEALENVSVSDDVLGLLLTGGTLAPGEVKTFLDQIYIPSLPDGGGSGPFDPSSASFSDTVTVTGEGAISGQPLDPAPFATATCPLCP